MKKLLPVLAIVVLSVWSNNLQSQELILTIKETHLDGGVSVSFDDGEYENDSIDKLDDDDLDMGWEGDDLNIMTTFTRFRDVTIPQGAIINSAVLEIYAHEDEYDEAIVTVFAEATDSSAMFTETEALADRMHTATTVPWVISDQWTMWQPYSSPDLSSIIQEIVDRPGWKSGNALTLFFQGQDQGASLLDQARDFESFENIEDPDDGGDGLHHPERVPKLTINYTTVGMNEVRQPSMMVYPNPVSGGTLKVELPQVAEGQASLHSIDGKVVLSQAFSGMDFSFDVSALSKGVYFLKVSDGLVDKTRRVIVE